MWFINTQLVLPSDRLIAANYIYQFSIFSFICTIVQVPYSAVMIAHEDMGIFAMISTLEAALKLMFALLLFVIPLDRLIFYGASLFLIPVLSLVSYIVIGYKMVHRMIIIRRFQRKFCIKIYYLFQVGCCLVL